MDLTSLGECYNDSAGFRYGYDDEEKPCIFMKMNRVSSSFCIDQFDVNSIKKWLVFSLFTQTHQGLLQVLKMVDYSLSWEQDSAYNWQRYFLANRNILGKDLGVKLSFKGYRYFLCSDCTVYAYYCFDCVFVFIVIIVYSCRCTTGSQSLMMGKIM